MECADSVLFAWKCVVTLSHCITLQIDEGNIVFIASEKGQHFCCWLWWRAVLLLCTYNIVTFMVNVCVKGKHLCLLHIVSRGAAFIAIACGRGWCYLHCSWEGQHLLLLHVQWCIIVGYCMWKRMHVLICWFGFLHGFNHTASILCHCYYIGVYNWWQVALHMRLRKPMITRGHVTTNHVTKHLQITEPTETFRSLILLSMLFKSRFSSPYGESICYTKPCLHHAPVSSFWVNLFLVSGLPSCFTCDGLLVPNSHIPW